MFTHHLHSFAELSKTIVILLTLLAVSVEIVSLQLVESYAVQECLPYVRHQNSLQLSGDEQYIIELQHSHQFSSKQSKAPQLQQSPNYFTYGHQYTIVIGERNNAYKSTIKMVYIVAVPVGTSQSREYIESRGIFTPTLCSDHAIGWQHFTRGDSIHAKFNWTSPTSHEQDVNDAIGHPKFRHCLELRVIIVLHGWAQVYYKSSHVICPKSRATLRSPRSLFGHQFNSDTPIDHFTPVDSNTAACSLQEFAEQEAACCACNTAVYSITIHSEWQRTYHWLDWPDSRPDGRSIPHWSEILGASHSPDYDVFHSGGNASPAVDALCTTGDVGKLENEFRNDAGDKILTVIRASPIDSDPPQGRRIRSALFAVNRTHHLISLLTRIDPSPDWCTGLSRVNLCQSNCSWTSRLRLSLDPWDAGVRSGETYSPDPPSERLREPIPMCRMTPSLRPNVPFTKSPQSDKFQQLGFVDIKLMRVNEHEPCNVDIVQKDQAFDQRFEDSVESSQSDWTLHNRGASKCPVTEWSSWGPCSTIDWTACSSRGASVQLQQLSIRTRSLIDTGKRQDECWDVKLKETKTCQHATDMRDCSQALIDRCVGYIWGPWSECRNATCSRLGMTYRWRLFPSNTERDQCNEYGLASQFDTCWPPPNCPLQALQAACSEQVPSVDLLCIHDAPTMLRYHFSPVKKQCLSFKYPPVCHWHAIQIDHPIGKTRNVFHDKTECEKLCIHG